MKVLDELVQDIANTYINYHRYSSLFPPICIYNGATLNGHFPVIGERLRTTLQIKGVSPPSITLSKESTPLPHHYAIDLEWFIQRYGVVLE